MARPLSVLQVDVTLASRGPTSVYVIATPASHSAEFIIDRRVYLTLCDAQAILNMTSVPKNTFKDRVKAMPGGC
jgi:hypothetical protein